jgi:hypothetical protein
MLAPRASRMRLYWRMFQKTEAAIWLVNTCFVLFLAIFILGAVIILLYVNEAWTISSKYLVAVDMLLLYGYLCTFFLLLSLASACLAIWRGNWNEFYQKEVVPCCEGIVRVALP